MATKRAIQNNELGISAPNSRILRQLGNLGVNLNWLIMGSGPMLLKDIHAADRWDADLLRFVIETVQQQLQQRNKKLPDAKFAELVALFYEYCFRTQSRELEFAERLVLVA